MKLSAFESLDKSNVEKLKSKPFFPVLIENDSLFLVLHKNKSYYKCWLATKIIPIANLMDEDTKEKHIEILYTTGFGEEKQIIPNNYITRKEAYQLTTYGLMFNESYTKELIYYLYRAISQAPCIITYSKIGWFLLKEDDTEKYVFRTDKILTDNQNADLNEKYKYVGGIDFKESLSVENYHNELNKLLTTGGTMFAIVAGLSSALVSLFSHKSHINNLLIHIFGDSSTGKSSFLRLALSCWGNPFKAPLANNYNTTTNAMFSILSNNFGVAVGFDEASCSYINFSNLIYNLDSGRDKSRCNSSSYLKSSKEWRTTIISTSEESLISKSKRNNGIKVRCLEFFNLQITTDSEHSNKIYSFSSENYGVLGIEFIHYLYKLNKDVIYKDYLRTKEELINKITQKTNLTDRLADLYAILLLTATYAKALKINIDLKYIESILLKHHNDMIVETNNEEHLYRKITEYIYNNNIRFPYSSDIFNSYNCEGYIQGNSIYICESTFEKILKDNGYSDTRVIVKKLYDKGFLDKNKDRYLFKKMFKKISVSFYKIIIKNDLD